MNVEDLEITIAQGSTYTLPLTFDDNDWGDDLSTGFEARMQIRADYADVAPGTPIADLSSAAGEGITLGTGEENIIVTISATDTAALDAADFPARYDLELEKTSTGEVKRLLQGQVKLDREVTI